VRTSAGIAAGIDMALLVVAELFGEAVARQTATYMEYPYPTGDARRVPVEGS
jgi:transcriptional regulator GlxA family with amidase domain